MLGSYFYLIKVHYKNKYEMESPRFRIYVIFHKFLVPECYETLTDEDISEHIRFVAVNHNIPKEIPDRLKPWVIEEDSLPWNDPIMQKYKFCESSVFFHAYKNPEIFLDEIDYIGFLHYDMTITKEALDLITMAATVHEKEEILFTQSTLTARPHLNQIFTLNMWDNTVKIYNDEFGTEYSIHDIIDDEIPLYHSFVLHRNTFERLMKFAERCTPLIHAYLNRQTTHMPFMLERLHGIFLALQRLDGNPAIWLPLPGVIHKDSLKDAWK